MPTDFTFWWFVFLAAASIFGLGYAVGVDHGFKVGRKR